jgi:hypothetical protein
MLCWTAGPFSFSSIWGQMLLFSSDLPAYAAFHFFLSLCSLASGCLQSDNGLGWLSGFSSGEKQIVWLTH